MSEGNRISGNKHAGVLVHGSGSRCRLKDSDVSGNGEMGVGVQKVRHTNVLSVPSVTASVQRGGGVMPLIPIITHYNIRMIHP